MKFKLIPLVPLFFLNSYTVSAADQFQYTELTKLNISPDEGRNLSGFGLEGKIKLSKNVYLNGAYQQYSNSESESNRGFIGLGYKYHLNNYLIPFSQLDYVNVDSKIIKENLSFSMKQYGFGVGIVGSVNNFQYKIGLSRYFIEESEVEDQTVKYLEAFYTATSSISIGGKAELTDDGDIYSLGIRYQF
jgi:outer membrane autotransporter protein